MVKFWSINVEYFPKQPYHMYNIQTYKCSVMMFGMINKLLYTFEKRIEDIERNHW